MGEVGTKTVWEVVSYRDYLLQRLGPEGTRSGLRKKLAEFIPVHTTFITQVIKGRNELSLEQAEAVSRFFDLTEDEADFFYLLIMHDRAGTERLKKHFQKQLQQKRRERLQIKKRLSVSDEISPQDRERFYSSALYAAVHVLAAIPATQTIESIAEALQLPRVKTKEVVEFLLSIGILKRQGMRLVPGSQHIHLSNESELILRHHINWRQFTINNLQFINRDDVHYSACLSLSQQDAYRIKEALLEQLKENLKIVAKSPEEVAYVFCLDFFKMA